MFAKYMFVASLYSPSLTEYDSAPASLSGMTFPNWSYSVVVISHSVPAGTIPSQPVNSMLVGAPNSTSTLTTTEIEPHATVTVCPPTAYGWKTSPNVPPIVPLLGVNVML